MGLSDDPIGRLPAYSLQQQKLTAYSKLKNLQCKHDGDSMPERRLLRNCYDIVNLLIFQ